MAGAGIVQKFRHAEGDFWTTGNLVMAPTYELLEAVIIVAVLALVAVLSNRIGSKQADLGALRGLDMMDDEGRFRISQMVAEHKGTDDVTPMSRESNEIAQKLPKTFISDGANNFHGAYRTEFTSQFGETESTVHIRHIRLAGGV